MIERRITSEDRRGRRRRAMTLMELLVVMSVISLMVAILLPALGHARHGANVATCLSNLKEIGRVATMYMREGREGTMLPSLPWHLGWNYNGQSVTLISEFVYGGFKAPLTDPDWGTSTDFYKYPTEWRPFNKYLAPGRQGGPVEVYVCPSDSFKLSPIVGQDPYQSPGQPSWQSLGNSYAINWYWYEDPQYNGCRNYGDLSLMSKHGSGVLRQKIGGPAAKFVIFTEGVMNAYLYDARPPGGSEGQSGLQTLGTGWHREYSKYSMAMLDGHAEYRFVDTRFTSDGGYNTRPEPQSGGCSP